VVVVKIDVPAVELLEHRAMFIGEKSMTNELPSGYLVRPARMDDLEAAVRMFNADAVHQIGVEKFTVQVYERAGMHSDPARQQSIYEKELRPGIDLRKQ
jgi:hypothetical protein